MESFYLFSIPEKEVKHYDSDTVSALANLAKCKISEQCSSCLSLEDFNEQPDIKFLLHQIKERSLTSFLTSSLAT